MEEEVKNQGGQQEENTEGLDLKKPLDKMTATELREVAMQIPGVEGAHAMKKEELLAIIKEYRGIKDEPAKGGKVKGEVRVAELKKRVVQLKEEKRQAREADDRKKVEILRRRLNRLKKKTRKAAGS